MRSSTVRMLAFTLQAINLPRGHVARSRIRCTYCRCQMALHMPDPDQPDRMLGTCLTCKSWFLIDRDEGVMFLMPDCHVHRGSVSKH